MIRLDPDRIAAEAGAEIAVRGPGGHPERGVVDSREVRAGDLFFGLAGEHANGGEFAGRAFHEGAWGAVVDRGWAGALERAEAPGWVFAADDPLRALQRVARAWRRELGCPVVGVTGSTGKTSVKDICRAILPGRIHASPENYNTEVGLPLAMLDADEETETLVLEMAMRGLGQIAELCEIAEPDVAAITNVGPVHLELLGTLEAIAEAKAEILGGLGPDGRAVVPADAEALEPHLHDSLWAITFGAGGDVFAESAVVEGGRTDALVGTPAGEARFLFPFIEAHNLTNALCAIAIGVALDADPEDLAARAPGIGFSRLRGETIELAGGISLINDCYNANPISMRAALDHLARVDAGSRRIAILGGMAELGPDGPDYHREIGAHARDLGIDAVIGVGELARDYAPDEWAADADAGAALADRILGDGDVVLVKGSRSVGLERLSDGLAARRAPDGPEGEGA
ncbi:MAG TPA: UDP-N-acetylmuramoyl-tripeptide--D-alanyl-D-alanine ligase [Solirubrobacterales bacterium]